MKRENDAFKIQSVLFVAVFLLLSGCSVFGIQGVEEAPFTVLRQDKSYEVRRYDPYYVARTSAVGDYETASEEAFERLFGYISGNNVESEKIEMTAPVAIQTEGEQIEMTAPVLVNEVSGDEESWQLSFVLPQRYRNQPVPQPLDRKITISRIPPQTVAVKQFSGVLEPDEMEEQRRALINWLDINNFSHQSEFSYAGFDPPWTIPFLRRNEVQVPVKDKVASDPT